MTDMQSTPDAFGSETQASHKAETNILEMLEQHGRMSCDMVRQRLNISQDTLEKLVDVLAKKEKLLRTNSSIVAINPVGYRLPKNKFPQEINVQNEGEEQIAKAALKYIKPKDTVYITSGNTGFLMLKYLDNPELPLTLITNSIVTANAVKYFENLTVYLVGGQMRRKGTLVDAMASRYVSEMHIDVSFLTGAGVSAEGGLTNNTNDVVQFQRSVMDTSRRNILMMPSDKIGFRSFLRVADLSEFDIFITDQDAYRPAVNEIAAKGPVVEIAE